VGTVLLGHVLPQMQYLMVDHIVQDMVGDIVRIEDGIHGYHTEGLVALPEAVLRHMGGPCEVGVPDIVIVDEIIVHQPLDRIDEILISALLAHEE